MLLLVTALALLLRIGCALAHPPLEDDLDVVLSAINYMEFGQLGPTMWNHPGLRNILAYAMVQLFGSGAVGVVGLDMLLGTLCVPLIHGVALRLTGERRVALTAALILAVEPLAVQYSCQAINDIYLVFFPLAAILAAYRYLDRGRTGWLVASGFAFGLGLASKWSALFQLAVIGPLVLYRSLTTPAWQGGRPARLLLVFCALLVLPATLYLASFAPWFSRGYSLAEWPTLQKSMYRETKLHTGYKERIYGDHRAGVWFLVPGVCHQDKILSLPEGPGSAKPNLRENFAILFTFANPLVWLAALPSLITILRRARSAKAAGLWVLAILFCISYLPLALTLRPIWFNSGVVVLPFLIIMVAYSIWHAFPSVGAGPRRIYLAAVCLVSLLLYPLAAGKGFLIPVVGDYLIEKSQQDRGESKDSFEQQPH